MNSGQTVNVMNEINNIKKLTQDEHIKMDIDDLDQSGLDQNAKIQRKKTKEKLQQEETVEELLAKLESKGKKIIIKDGEEE